MVSSWKLDSSSTYKSGTGCSSRSSAGSPKIAAGEHAPSGGGGHARDQARHRALAVRAGDADDRRPHGAREQLDVAQHLDAAGARARCNRLLERYAGRHQHLRCAVEQRQIEAAQADIERFRETAEFGEPRRRAARIGGRDRDAALCQVAQARSSRFAETDDDACHHRIFKVARPASTSMKLMIQKRTITFGSDHPLSSK